MPSEVANIFLTSYRREENMRTMGNGKVTHLDNLVPTARDDDGVHDVGAEAHARHPKEERRSYSGLDNYQPEEVKLTTQCGHHP